MSVSCLLGNQIPAGYEVFAVNKNISLLKNKINQILTITKPIIKINLLFPCKKVCFN